MQKTTSNPPSRLWVSGIIVLLLVQGILGLLVSISQLSRLLAPGSPIIVTGLNIITGPLAGIAFVVAIASLLVPWWWWTHNHWTRHRILLIECISVALGIIEFIEPHFSWSIPLVRIVLALLLLLCLFVTRTHRTYHQHTQASHSIAR